MPYGITQCYLPPGRGDIPAFTQAAEAGTRLSDPRGGCGCKDRSLYTCFKYLLTKLSNNIDVFVIFKWSLTLAIFETIVETTQAIL